MYGQILQIVCRKKFFCINELTTGTINMNVIGVNNQGNKIVYKTDNVVIAKLIGFINHPYIYMVSRTFVFDLFFNIIINI